MPNSGGITYQEREEIIRALREGREPVTARSPDTIEKFRAMVNKERRGARVQLSTARRIGASIVVINDRGDVFLRRLSEGFGG